MSVLKLLIGARIAGPSISVVQIARNANNTAIPIANPRASLSDRTAVAFASAMPATAASDAIERSAVDLAADCADVALSRAASTAMALVWRCDSRTAAT